MSSQETMYKYRRGLNIELRTLSYFSEVGTTKRNQQKKLKISRSAPETKERKVSKKRKLPTTSNASAATSSEIRIENWLGNLSPRRSLVSNLTRAVNVAWRRKKKQLQWIQDREGVLVTTNNNS